MLNCIDYTVKNEFYFTNPQTWILWAIVDLHDYLMYFLINVFIIVIVFTVVCLFFQQTWFKLGGLKIKWWKSRDYERAEYILKNKFIIYMYNKFKLYSFNHAPLLEFFWTITPALMLVAMGWPSFRVLYAMEQLIDPIHTIIIVGNQWYWTYNYTDFDIVSDMIQQLDSNNLANIYIEEILSANEFIINKQNIKKKKLLQAMSKYLRKFEESKINYDCVIISDESLPKGYPRLLSTDQVLVLPTYVSIRLLVTSIDVIHSWALPSHGIKMDAIPGRVNQINFLVQTVGTYWGQCSELCGINHGFMPIEVRVLPLDDYLTYIALNISYRQDKLLLIAEKFFEAFIFRENKKFIEKIIMNTIENSLEIYEIENFNSQKYNSISNFFERFKNLKIDKSFIHSIPFYDEKFLERIKSYKESKTKLFMSDYGLFTSLSCSENFHLNWKDTKKVLEVLHFMFKKNLNVYSDLHSELYRTYYNSKKYELALLHSFKNSWIVSNSEASTKVMKILNFGMKKFISVPDNFCCVFSTKELNAQNYLMNFKNPLRGKTFNIAQSFSYKELFDIKIYLRDLKKERPFKSLLPFFYTRQNEHKSN